MYPSFSVSSCLHGVHYLMTIISCSNREPLSYETHLLQASQQIHLIMKALQETTVHRQMNWQQLRNNHKATKGQMMCWKKQHKFWRLVLPTLPSVWKRWLQGSHAPWKSLKEMLIKNFSYYFREIKGRKVTSQSWEAVWKTGRKDGLSSVTESFTTTKHRYNNSDVSG